MSDTFCWVDHGNIIRKVIYVGCKNRYSFIKDGKSIILSLLTPTRVYENQIKLKNEKKKRLRELESKRENREVTSSEKKE